MKMIFITTEFEGFHKYPNAPEEVSFLRDFHRHIFKVKVSIEVFHNERDIEFILFKRYINSLISNGDMNCLSCEAISDILFEKINEKYPNRKITIEVSEDGENGSWSEYNV